MWRYFLCFNSGAWRNIIKTCYDIGATFLAHLVIRSEWTVRLTVNLLRIEGADLRKGRGGGRSQFASAKPGGGGVRRSSNKRTNSFTFRPTWKFPGPFVTVALSSFSFAARVSVRPSLY